VREDLGQDVRHEPVFGGDLCVYTFINLSERGRRNVEVAFARLRLFALGPHASAAIKRILGLLRRNAELGIDAIPVLGTPLVP
jgi:hypothetical protein